MVFTKHRNSKISNGFVTQAVAPFARRSWTGALPETTRIGMNGYFPFILQHCCPVNFFEKQVNYMNLN